MVRPGSALPRPRRPPPLDFCGSDRFKGVRRRSWGSWVSEIRIPHSRNKIWLGSYGTPEQAARAYDIASLLLRGPSCSAFLNFPDSTSLVHSANPHLASLAAAGFPPSPHTIQATAAAAAAAVSGCSPPTNSSSVTTTADRGADELSVRGDSVPQACAGIASSAASAPHACWIQDVMALILSPKEKNGSPAPQSSPSVSKPAAPAAPPQPNHICSRASYCASSRVTSAECFLRALMDGFQCPLEGITNDGFTAISIAVTTHKRFDTETAFPAHDGDGTQLWDSVC